MSGAHQQKQSMHEMVAVKKRLMASIEIILVKGAQSYFLKNWFSASFEESFLQIWKYKIWVKTVKLFRYTKQFCDLQLPISCCVSLIMVTRHVFISIFQTEHISAIKFDMGYEKNTSFLEIPKSTKVWKQSWEKKDSAHLTVFKSLAYQILKYKQNL